MTQFFWPFLSNLYIKDKHLNVLRLGDHATWVQRKIIAKTEELMTDGKPVRIIILKARQMGCSTIIEPALLLPVITFTTPAGSPASATISANNNAVSLVYEAGFNTTVLPIAIAGAIFHASINSGKFHGMICPATPSGCGVLPGNAYFNLSAQPA